MSLLPALPASYPALLASLKTRIAHVQVRASRAACRELLALYWSIGRDIVLRQEEEGWGSAVIDHLGQDLQCSFPGSKGFSPRNLWRMRAFYKSYLIGTDDDAIVDGFLPQAVAEIPWGHHVLLLERLKDPEIRRWYSFAAQQHGWSRAVMVVHMDSGLHRRQGQAVTNFTRTLPAPESDLAQQTLKDPYVFDFMTLAPDAHELALERGLMAHVEHFLLELGTGFALVGRQIPLTVGNQDFRIDLLFYHLTLRCYVVIELKSGAFMPEFAGKLNFYLSAIDAQRRQVTDGPTIGLLLCKTKDRMVVEYALRDLAKPIGVADWQAQLTESLPENLVGTLPTVEQLESELGPHPDQPGAMGADDAV